MTDDLRLTEVCYIRAQTIIAALNLAATIMIAATGIWITRQVDAGAKAEREYQAKVESDRATQRERAELVNACLSLKLSELSQKRQEKSLDIELRNVSSAISERCKAAGLELDSIDLKNASRDATDAIIVLGIAKFLSWSQEKPLPPKSAKP